LTRSGPGPRGCGQAGGPAAGRQGHAVRPRRRRRAGRSHRPDEQRVWESAADL